VRLFLHAAAAAPYNRPAAIERKFALTTVTASDITASPIGDHHHFLLRRLHSLTGIVFGGYLVIHLLINASLIQGTSPADIFQKQVDKIHALPFLAALEWTFIYLPILFHTIYGIWITLGGQPNNADYPFAKNWFYLLQRVSAIVIVFFIAFHVFGMKGWFGKSLSFDPVHATSSLVRHVNVNWSVAYFVYPLGILASCYHLANGFWTAAITWGLTISSASQRRWGWVCAALFVFTLACGFTALFAGIAGRNSPLSH
jgi:succinate dehydrogenase / fumarate reductase cytochrome b subunit